jgi:5S rRNA maturation endonuclease (ribonuclease M5)
MIKYKLKFLVNINGGFMHKKRIEEVIVVEGKDDISAVKRAVDANLPWKRLNLLKKKKE